MRFRTARMMRPAARVERERGEEKAAALIAVTYELLDAHADTDRLVSDEASDAEWQNHLAYLRDLQRVGREALARVGAPGAATSSASSPGL
jgi:hypothetical protein